MSESDIHEFGNDMQYLTFNIVHTVKLSKANKKSTLVLNR